MPRDPKPGPRLPLVARPPGWLERWAARAVVVLPAGIALARLATRPTWREDVPVLRDLALVGTGPGGGVSTALSQLAMAIPLGTSTFRAALVAVAALAIASRAGFAIALRLLRAADADAASPTPAWVAPGFAAIGVTGAVLGPTLQLESTVLGGAAVATALVLVAVALALRAIDPAADTARGRDLVTAGVFAGAAAAERPSAAVAAVLAIVALLLTSKAGAWIAPRWPFRREEVVAAARRRFVPLPRRALVLSCVLGVATFVAGLLPAVLRPHAPARALDLGGALTALPPADAASLVSTALQGWIVEMGWVPLVLAGLGALVLVARGATRPGAAALLALVGLDALAPARLAGGVGADLAACLRCLAVMAIAVAAAVGLHEAVFRLLRARVPYARPAAALLIAFQATVVALASEKASEVADRDDQRGAEEWLDASRDAFEARSLVLVHGVPKAARLWAAQLSFGYRPDVVVVSASLVARSGITADLLAREPRAHGVIRALALSGIVDGFALSELADARSLHVEPDRSWDARTASHVELDGVWLHLDPQPIGRNDRRRSTADSIAPLTRLLTSLSATEAPDAATADVVGTTLREQALILSRVGEVETARALASEARHLGPTSSVASPAAAVLLAALEATAPAPSGSSSPLEIRRTSLR